MDAGWVGLALLLNIFCVVWLAIGCQQVKALQNHRYGYRRRVGKYRILFDWDSIVRIVSIEEVKKRNERTY